MTTITEDEDREPVGEPRDPRRVFTELAIKTGAMAPGAELSEELWEYAQGIVDLCAAIGERYVDENNPEANAGDHIRAEFYE